MAQFVIDADEEVLAEVDVTALQTALGEFVHADVPLCIEFVFVTDEEIKTLNAQTRDIDKVTDVLSFPTLDDILEKEILAENFPFDIDEDGKLCIGSVVVCREKAQEQATEFGHSYKRELHYLLVHGVMHCLGYDHMQDDDKAKMRKAEESILQKIEITRA